MMAISGVIMLALLLVFPGKGCWLLPAGDRCCQVPETAVTHKATCFQSAAVKVSAGDTMMITCLREVMSADYA